MESLSHDTLDSREVVVSETLSTLRLPSAVACQPNLMSSQLNGAQDSEWLAGLLRVLRPVVNLSVDQIRKKCEKDANVGTRPDCLKRRLWIGFLLADRAMRGMRLGTSQKLLVRCIELLLCSAYFADFGVRQIQEMAPKDRKSSLISRLGISMCITECLRNVIHWSSVARGANPLTQTALDVCIDTVGEASHDRVAFPELRHSDRGRFYYFRFNVIGGLAAADLKQFDLAVALIKDALEYDDAEKRLDDCPSWAALPSSEDLSSLIEIFERLAREARAASEGQASTANTG